MSFWCLSISRAVVIDQFMSSANNRAVQLKKVRRSTKTTAERLGVVKVEE